MKKNRTMRAASLLLALTLITSTFVGGTFAKYVTTAEATAQARVAKWGVELSVSGDLFGTDYTSDTKNDGTVVVSAAYDTDNNGANDDVVAPGTHSDQGVTFKLKGKPEVAFKLTASLVGKDDKGNAVEPEDVLLAKGTYTDYTKVTGSDDEGNPVYGNTFTLEKDYHPVVFTLVHSYADGGYSIMPDGATLSDYTPSEIYKVVNETGKVSITGTLEDINAVFAKVSENMSHVDPNYPLNDTFKLTWAWAFDQNPDAVDNNDRADTLLGNLAADENKYKTSKVEAEKVKDLTAEDYNLDVKYNFSITVEQVDGASTVVEDTTADNAGSGEGNQGGTGEGTNP